MSSGINLPLNVTVGSTPISNGTNNTLLRNEGGIVGDTDYTVPKTDGTAGQVLQTNGAGVVSFQTISTGITVGTTAVTSGTDGRVFFQAGGVVQQDANFTYDNTLKRLGLKAVGTAATDIPFVVQNSAGTLNNLTVNGLGLITSNVAAPASYVWTNHLNSVRYESGSPITNVTIKTNYPFVESFYIGRNTGTANSDASTSAGLVYSHQGEFTVRNTQTGGYYGITLNAEQNLEQRVGIDTGRTAFGLGWSLRNFTNSVDYINFSPTTARVGIGWNSKGAVLGAILDVKAQGALSTDIAFRVRNSADTADILKIQGNTNVIFGGVGSDYLSIVGGASWGTDCYFNFSGGNYIRYLGQGGNISIFTNSNLRSRGTYIGGSAEFVYFDNGGNIRIGQGFSGSNQPDANATRTLQQMTGVAPTTSVADGFQQYSADITAGNAAPHFRTENGSIVKLYQETTGVAAAALVSNAGTALTSTDTFDGYTMQQIVKALRNLGILA